MPEKPAAQKPDAEQHVTPEISDEQALLIGQVIVLWSKLEAAIEDTIWMFLELDDEDGKLITKRLGADAKMQMLTNLGQRRITDEGILASFNETITLSNELKENRNFIAHGVWGTLMPDNLPIALSLKPKSEVGDVMSETFDKDRMEATRNGIRAALQRLVDLPEQLGKSRRVPQEPAVR